jgi:AraC-like DNA-binding protein
MSPRYGKMSPWGERIIGEISGRTLDRAPDDREIEAMYGTTGNGPEDLVFYYAGQEDCRPGHSWNGVRDHFLVHYILKGRGRVFLKGGERILGQGDGFLVRPGELARYRADEADPWSYAWFAYSGKKAAEVTRGIGVPEDGSVFTCGEDSAFAKTYRRNVAALSATSEALGQLALLYRILADMKSALAREPASFIPGTRTDAYIEGVNEFIGKNYSRHGAGIEAMATRIGLSRKYLSKIVRERTGKTPKELIVEYRMRKASELLADTNLSVASVAYSVGYEDQLAFSKGFRKRFGISPRAFRNRD